MPFLQVATQLTDEPSQAMTTSPATVETTPLIIGPFSVEILAIYVTPGIGNAVKLVWGGGKEQDEANLTYGLYFGSEEGELECKCLFFHLIKTFYVPKPTAE